MKISNAKSTFLIGIVLLIITFFLLVWAAVNLMQSKSHETILPCDCVSVVDGRNLCAQFSFLLVAAFSSLTAVLFLVVKSGKTQS